MSDILSAIERLPLETQAKLRSTQILTSLPHIVSELVQNSLDANASRIDAGVNFKEWMCWVRDDGHGISKDGLERLAHADKTDTDSGHGRYNTSKTYAQGSSDTLSTFGFRGEALASAADIACLEICSRTSKSRNTWSIILKGSQTLYVGPAVRWQRESPGTAVCVRDAFYNLPVRRLSHASPARAWDLVHREIETYALMFPHVTFSLEDASQADKQPQHKERIFRIPKTASTLQCFRRLYGSALTEHIHTVLESSAALKIEGFISLTGAHSKAYQFLYVNRHPVINSDLVREIDQLFASSSFGKNALDEERNNSLPRSTIRRSPRKSEKKPVYVLNISIAPEQVDNCLEPTKSTIQLRNKSSVMALLSSVIQSFLTKNGFQNQDQVAINRSASSSPSPRKRKKLALEEWGHEEHYSMSEISTLSLHDNSEASLREGRADLYTTMDGTSQETLWMDPSTGERFLIDSRTGNSFHQLTNRYRRPNEETINDSRCEAGRRTLWQHKTKNSAINNTLPHSAIPGWLEKALESNSAYAATENRIHSVKVPPAKYHITGGHDVPQHDERGYNHPETDVLSRGFKLGKLDTRYETSSHQFTKDDLRRAEVISQVDRKFIACRISKHGANDASMAPSNQHREGSEAANSDSTLVLIDQHAADERVRVEYFLKELCLGFLYSQDRTEGERTSGIRTTELNPPRPVLLTQHEARSINGSQDVQEMFRKWGVGFAELSKFIPDAASESGSINGYSQLLVSSIPRVVCDKLLQGNELRDLIKGFLAQIQSGELFSATHIALPPEAEVDKFFWLKAVRWCPKALLDLVTSKACRGAIMFNDSLSATQCEKLVRQLSETAFPFQCAHGRPSLVPLIEIGAEQAAAHNQRNRRRNDWTRLQTIADG
ncbi:hypothetical protein BDN70DRAFT_930536 [Pholiota conissans]|uniref:MutL C-terminal dimerisation domain-containing protein n=1 Tax=Pholiota conissans TaxID=109636 RepID=A0A9P5Z764_9AGAR|nr:hypothetical protein BDN70DRAFT_930536 [Pholiota conissans]